MSKPRDPYSFLPKDEALREQRKRDLNQARAAVVAARAVHEAVVGHIYDLCKRNEVPFAKFHTLGGRQAEALRKRKRSALAAYRSAVDAYTNLLGTTPGPNRD